MRIHRRFVPIAWLSLAAMTGCSSSRAAPDASGSDVASSDRAAADTAVGSDTGADATNPGTDAGGSGDSGAPSASRTCTLLTAPTSAGVDTYHHTAPSGLAAGVTFATDWSALPTSGGWEGLQIIDACRMHPDGFVTQHGRAAVRVEVDPYDDPLGLGENTERSEALDAQDATGALLEESSASGTQYYATSYYLPSTWAATEYPYHVFQTAGGAWPHGVSADCSAGNDCSSWSIVLQIHQGSAGPLVGLHAASADVGAPQLYTWIVGDTSYPVGSVTRGHWTDFVFEIGWATGAFTIWRRDDTQTAFAQAVQATNPMLPQMVGGYLKQGIYRGGTVNGRTDVLWIGPTARGGSFAAVEASAFGTHSGP